MPRQSRDEYVSGALAQISEFEEKLSELEADMESGGWDDIGEYRTRLDGLRLSLRSVREKSEELEAVPDSAWPSARGEMESLLLEVAAGVEDLSAELSGVLPE